MLSAGSLTTSSTEARHYNLGEANSCMDVFHCIWNMVKKFFLWVASLFCEETAQTAPRIRPQKIQKQPKIDKDWLKDELTKIGLSDEQLNKTLLSESWEKCLSRMFAALDARFGGGADSVQKPYAVHFRHKVHNGGEEHILYIEPTDQSHARVSEFLQTILDLHHPLLIKDRVKAISEHRELNSDGIAITLKTETPS